MTRRQLVELGLSSHAVKHRLKRGRLRRIFRGVYAVGRPGLSREGEWMATVLACGQGPVLSHTSAAALWEIASIERPIEVSIPLPRTVHRAGIRAHRRQPLGRDQITEHHRIPVTTPVQTLLDLATRLDRGRLEATIIEADKRDLVTPDRLRESLDEVGALPGTGILRRILDRHTFVLTDSELERRFLPIARRAGLPRPLTGQRVNGFKVDFYWPDLASSLRRMACATTARRSSRLAMLAATRFTPRQV